MSNSDQAADRLKLLMIRLYNAGYKAGHHDTVEGGYVDIFDCDRDEYHEDVVSEIMDEWELGANATLMADAPELLKTLQELCDHLVLPYGDWRAKDKAEDIRDKAIGLIERHGSK